MARYVMKFTKDGYVKYTSHLDLLRLFKRSFKRTGIDLKYSQGFNPHPQMSFAQPLALGYSSRCELIEFETMDEFDPQDILTRLQKAMPDGISPVSCMAFDSPVKSLAGEADSAEYRIWIPLNAAERALMEETDRCVGDYMSQPEIIAMKRQKKTKALVPVDIKRQIRKLNGEVSGDELILDMMLDCGSYSNLSPELVIATFCDMFGLSAQRYAMDVERTAMHFSKDLQF